MAFLAIAVALGVGVFAAFGGAMDSSTILRSVLELGAVIGVFALICAAEASH